MFKHAILLLGHKQAMKHFFRLCPTSSVSRWSAIAATEDRIISAGVQNVVDCTKAILSKQIEAHEENVKHVQNNPATKQSVIDEIRTEETTQHTLKTGRWSKEAVSGTSHAHFEPTIRTPTICRKPFNHTSNFIKDTLDGDDST